MNQIINFLFETKYWPQRWQCGEWTNSLGWVHILSEVAIFIAYLAIPIALSALYYKRRDFPLPGLAVLFSLFIFSCGINHLLQAIIFWYPVYRLAGLVLLITAIVSWVTVITALFAAKKIINLPQLEKVNQLLERDLNESRKRLELSFSGTDAGLWDWNIRTGQMRFSSFFAQIMGFDPHEQEKSYEDFVLRIHPKDRIMFQKAIEKHLFSKVPFQAKFRMLVKGKYRWFQSRGLALWDSSEKAIRMTGSITNIQDTIDAENKLIEMNQNLQKEIEQRELVEEKIEQAMLELEDKKNEMENFLHIVTHDLRSPLINIKGFSAELNETMKSLSSISEETKKDLNQSLTFIHNSINSIDNLVEALVKLSEIGGHKLSLEKIDTNDLVQGILKGKNYQITQKEIDVTVKDLPVVVADRVALEQILSNLIDNAIKYLNPNRKGKIQILGKQCKEYTEFIIQDNGIGIAYKDKHKVFEFLGRLHNNKESGQGMGLPFIKALVQRHHGTVDFYSTVGEGTRFFFTLVNQTVSEKVLQYAKQ